MNQAARETGPFPLKAHLFAALFFGALITPSVFWLRSELRRREPASWFEVEASITSRDFSIARGEAYIPVTVRVHGATESGSITLNERDANSFSAEDVGAWLPARAFRGMTGSLEVCPERAFEPCQAKTRNLYLAVVALLVVLALMLFAWVQASVELHRKSKAAPDAPARG